MSEPFNVTLPSGAEMTLSEPIPEHLRKQIAKGVLRRVESAEAPPADVDGDDGAERVSAPSPVDPSTVPAGTASRDEWEAHAVAMGVDANEAAGMRREELKAHPLVAQSGSDAAGETGS
jgi:hypothetical protein